jgi:hypothetical protein
MAGMNRLEPLFSLAALVDARGVATREFHQWLSEVCDRLPITGTATFAAGTSVVVDFTAAGLADQVDTNYIVVLEPVEDKTFWVTSKNVGDFTLNASVATSAEIKWALLRI